MREEDNIEKGGLQEDSSENDIYDGLEDFVEYDDLTSLEGLPQLDELDKADDLSVIPDIVASIDMDDSKLKSSTVEDDMEIPLPEIGITDEDGVASELSDGKDIKTTFPQLESEDENLKEDEKEELGDIEDDVPSGDTMSLSEGEEEAPEDIMSLSEEQEEAPEDIMSLSEEQEEAPEDIMSLSEKQEEAPEDIMSLSEEQEEEAPEDIMSLSGGEEQETPEDIMSLSEGEGEEEEAPEDIMSLSEGEEEEPSEDIMSLLGGEDESTDNDNIDDMLGGLLDNLDTNGSISTGENTDNIDETESKVEAEHTEDISDLLGMLSDDSDEIISLDSTSEDMIPDISEIPDTTVDMADTEDIADILPTAQKEEKKADKPGFFKRIFGNVVTDEIAEAERRQKEEEEAKLEELEKEKEEKALEKAKKAEEKAKIKEEKAAEKAAKKAKKAEEKAAKKAEKLAKKEEEEAAAAQEVVGKLNKAGVSIVVAAGVIFVAGIIIGTNSFGGNLEKKKAQNYFEMNKYSQAYDSAVGTNMKKKDPEQYQKIVTVMKVQHALDSYQSYESVKKYPEALDALLMGLKKYDANKQTAYNLEIEDKLEALYGKILDILSDEFGLSKSQAYDILGLSSSEYSKKVTEIATK